MVWRRLTPSRMLMRLRRLVRNDQLILSILAVAVGAAAGGGTILLREGISLIQGLSFGGGAENFVFHASHLAWWKVLLVPTLGGLLIGLFFHYVMPGGRPQGVAKVIEASALTGGRMPLGAGLGAALASAASLGVGASVGREGPAVHLGATLGGWLAARLHLTRSLSRALLGCGAAAAVAASFNAPLAGALFAHEVVVGHFALSAFAPIVIASVVGTIVSRGYFGDFPAFTIIGEPVVSLPEFPAVVGLGILCGAFAILFMRATMLAEDSFNKAPGPTWLRPAIGGLAVGLIALILPHVLGVGYAATDAALKGTLALHFLIALVIAKTAATAISLGAGFGGGVFSPSLMIGAMLGGAYGLIAAGIFPNFPTDPAAYTIIGMGALAAAVLNAPISTTLIVFELTGDYALTVAVMIAVVISSVITQQFHGRSFFAWQLERAGLDIKGGFETAALRAVKVSSILDENSDTVPIGLGLAEIRARLLRSPTGELFALRESGELYGTITLADLSDLAMDREMDNLINAGDVARRAPPVLEAGDDLQAANRVIRDSGEACIAVVDSLETMRFVGALRERDVMAAYNRALHEARAEERGD